MSVAGQAIARARRFSGPALFAALLAAAPAEGGPKRPEILTSDVDRFFRIYDATAGRPTAELLDRDYLGSGSPGLHEFAKLRNVTGERIAAQIAARPDTYTDARRCLAALPAVKRRLTAAFSRFASLYPQASFPPVTIVVGRGRPVGITNPSGVTIGLEALCAADFMDANVEDRFVHVIAHEYGHVQQSTALQAMNPGDPEATVLRMSLMEGVGEFTAELISGGIAEPKLLEWTRGHEAEIEARFVRAEDSRDLSTWMYNGPGDADRPSDLGYWVGYRIVKAYYAHAHDKRGALKVIYEMSDPTGFVAASGWTPGS